MLLITTFTKQYDFIFVHLQIFHKIKVENLQFRNSEISILVMKTKTKFKLYNKNFTSNTY